MKEIAVLLANGFEEVEALTVVDYCRRAGLRVTTAAVSSGSSDRAVVGSHHITVLADALAADVKGDSLDALVIPGGMPGAANIAADSAALALIASVRAAGKIVAAECAAPAVVLAPRGFLAGRRWTCYPGLESGITDGTHCTDSVVSDGTLITSQGPGAAAGLAFALITALTDAATAERTAAAACVR